MNGKFSTLLAGILLASAFSANAADVVQVTKLINGKQYVVAQDAWNKTTKKAVLKSNDAGTGVIGVVGDVAEYANVPKWTVVATGTSTNQAIKDAAGKYLNGAAATISLNGTLTDATQFITYSQATPSIKIGTQSNLLQFDAAVMGKDYVTISDNASGKAAFYALAYEATDEGMKGLVADDAAAVTQSDVFLKIGDKYVAAKSLAAGETDVELIDLDSSKPGYYEAVKRAT